jgi:uncharacterized coiled-coil protein SlyX
MSIRPHRFRLLRLAPCTLALALAGCAAGRGAEVPARADEPAASAASAAQRKKQAEISAEDARARERELAALEIRLMERDALIEDLNGRLEDTREEVVRAMAKLQSLATRAEAASAMAEVDVALRSLKDAGRESQEPAQVSHLMRQSTDEFVKQNYGGALYLANQAKASLARVPRAGGFERSSRRPGEAVFAIPLRLRVTTRANVREGPGTSHAVVFTVEPGTELTGRTYLGEWLRVTDRSGRAGWIAHSLVDRLAAPRR